MKTQSIKTFTNAFLIGRNRLFILISCSVVTGKGKRFVTFFLFSYDFVNFRFYCDSTCFIEKLLLSFSLNNKRKDGEKVCHQLTDIQEQSFSTSFSSFFHFLGFDTS